MNADISRQHPAKRVYVAGARGGVKGLREGEAPLFFYLETRLRLADMGACASCELAASRGIALDGFRDLLKFQPENIVEQKCGPLQRRKAFQRKHQRQSNVFIRFLFYQGIGKPSANIRLALMSRRF